MPTEGSAANTSLKVCIKLIAIFVTFPAVLLAGIVSKGAIFFMTSQIGREMTQLASGDSLQHLNGIACWLWTLLFSFTVPELLVFIQSLRICFSRRKLWKRPRLVQFVIAFGLESAQTVGMALLVGSVLPYLSVTHGVLITNCVYLVPAILNFLAREPTKPIMRLMDALSFLTQLSGCLHWIFIRHSLGSNSQMIDWILPVSLILISSGWWENHVYRDAPISFIRYFGQIKEEMTKTRPFAYIIISAWKVVLFFATIFSAAEMTFVAQEAYDGAFDSCSFVIRGGFNQFCYSFMSVEWTSPFYIFIIQATSSFLFYWFGNFACQIGVKSTCFAIPVVLLTPVIMTITSHFEIAKIFDGHFHAQLENQQSFVYLLALSFFWFLSQTWITLHIWSPTAEISDELVSDAKWYNSLLIDQSMSFSPTRHYNKVSESTKCSMMTRVFAVATMWHETSDEMLIILKSIFRMDKDQSRRHLARYCNNKVIDPHCYHYETHIFFDDAFESHSKDGTTSRVVNRFVNQLIELMDKMKCKRTSTCDRKSPVISVTPYGGRLEWTLPGNTKMTVHLKDKSKIRVKKRWSQVMYIDYLIRYEIGNHSDLENTFLLTLDGDMDFRPKAVHILMDVMNSKRDVGIACNRSHPTGSAGPMVWYQMYEYAVGFWLLKPSESVLGDILCAAGCFSLIRATVLLDGDVMSKFVERSEKAHHFIQRDQGEDRWLCTLLIKRGYRLAYSASSYAYTRCPETFDEFYNQRRRWTLSIISNTLDLLWNCRRTVKLHPTISWIFMIFQALSLAMSLLSPGSVFLVLVNTSATTFFIDKWISLLVHSALIFGFIIICFVAPSRIQLRVAKCLSAFYGLIVAAVLIDSVISLAGFNLQNNLHGNKMSFSVSNAFLLFLTSCVFLAGCLHPREVHCLLAGPIYLLLTPSMSMLLVLYSVINMNVVSWGTRDASVTIGVQSPNKATKLDNRQSNKVVTNSQEVFSPAMDKTKSDEKASSDYTASINWSLEAESHLPEQRNVKELPGEECSFWRELIQSKLFPFVENRKEEKDRISADLDRLRNFSFTIFFLLNSLFVATIFGCQMKSDGPESSEADTVSQSNELTSSILVWLSEANPAQLTVIFFAGSMLFVQFVALLSFRLDNLSRMLSSTSLNIFRFKTESHEKSNAETLSNQVVLLSYGTTNEDSTRNQRGDLCQMNPNSWI